MNETFNERYINSIKLPSALSLLTSQKSFKVIRPTIVVIFRKFNAYRLHIGILDSRLLY